MDIKNIEVIQGDALEKLKFVTSNLKNYKITGNIPYYITGKLLRIISELENKPKLTVLTIQKEVAERITAQPPHMNLLAAAVQYWAQPKIIFTLKPTNFSPPPKVESAVIKLENKEQKPEIENSDNFYKFIHIIFKQPRKTLVNNLRSGTKLPLKNIENMLKNLKIDEKARPQDLSLEQIKKIASLFT